jgi:hypothetical protein
MLLQNMTSCGIQEIGSIHTLPTAEDALISFCKQKTGYSPSPEKPCLQSNLHEFYVFSGFIGMDGAIRETAPYNIVPEFVKLIEDNNLGEVWKTKVGRNRAVHPNHTYQAYIWSPDVERLQEWYRGTLVKPTVKVEVKVETMPQVVQRDVMNAVRNIAMQAIPEFDRAARLGAAHGRQANLEEQTQHVPDAPKVAKAAVKEERKLPQAYYDIPDKPVRRATVKLGLKPRKRLFRRGGGF